MKKKALIKKYIYPDINFISYQQLGNILHY